MDSLQNIYRGIYNFLSYFHQIFIEMRAIQLEKYEIAETAFMTYENVLRKTCKMMEEHKPKDTIPKEAYHATKLMGVIDGKY